MNNILSVIPCKDNLKYTKMLFNDLLNDGSSDIFIIDNSDNVDSSTHKWWEEDVIHNLKEKQSFVYQRYSGKYNVVSEMWNLGLQEAKYHGYKYCAILNNDIRMPVGSFDIFKELIENNDKTLCIFPEFTVGLEFNGFLNPINTYTKKVTGPTAEAGMTGICWFLNINVVDKIGYFDEQFDIAWQDNDYTKRMIDVGYLPLVTNKVVIHHYGSQTVWKEDRWLERGMEDKIKYQRKWGFVF